MHYVQLPINLCSSIWSLNQSEGYVMEVLKCSSFKPPVIRHLSRILSLSVRMLFSYCTHDLFFLFQSTAVYFRLAGEGSIYFLLIYHIFFYTDSDFRVEYWGWTFHIHNRTVPQNTNPPPWNKKRVRLLSAGYGHALTEIISVASLLEGILQANCRR